MSEALLRFADRNVRRLARNTHPSEATPSDPPRRIAVRGHVEPIRWRPRTPHRSVEPWPEVAVCFATAPRRQPGEPLLAGMFAIVVGTEAHVHERKLFIANDLTTNEGAGVADFAARHEMDAPISVKIFLDELHELSYLRGFPMVAFNLGVHIGRLLLPNAWSRTGSRRRYDLFRTGISTIPWTAAEPGGRSHHKRVIAPGIIEGDVRLCLVSHNGQTFYGFRRRRRQEGAERRAEGGRSDSFAGHFVDVRKIAEAQTGDALKTLEQVCSAYDLNIVSAAGEEMTADLERAAAELDAVVRLYRMELQIHEALAPGYPIDRIHSSAGYLRAMWA